MNRTGKGASGAIIRKSFLIVVVAVLGVSPGGFAR
jgi:hypothetical protein